MIQHKNIVIISLNFGKNLFNNMVDL